jgi:hypothetical protein
MTTADERDERRWKRMLGGNGLHREMVKEWFVPHYFRCSGSAFIPFICGYFSMCDSPCSDDDGLSALLRKRLCPTSRPAP